MKINKCKVCGSQPELKHEYSDFYRVKCPCGMATTTQIGAENAIKDWNGKNEEEVAA